jgi:hypothetical protein
MPASVLPFLIIPIDRLSRTIEVQTVHIFCKMITNYDKHQICTVEQLLIVVQIYVKTL